MSLISPNGAATAGGVVYFMDDGALGSGVLTETSPHTVDDVPLSRISPLTTQLQVQRRPDQNCENEFGGFNWVWKNASILAAAGRMPIGDHTWHRRGKAITISVTNLATEEDVHAHVATVQAEKAHART